MRRIAILASIVLIPFILASARSRAPIVDGQHNHDRQHTTPVLKKILEDFPKAR